MGFCHQDHVTHCGGGSEEFDSGQGAGCDQLVDSSWIDWHQGEVSSIINLRVATSLGSTCLWSAVFLQKGSASCKNNLGMCARPLSVSFNTGSLIILLCGRIRV